MSCCGIRKCGRGFFGISRINKDVDILLTSFETEGMHGMELVWETRMLEADDRPLYIIAMSSDQEITKAVEALDCGADDFIRKPPVAEELKARVRSAQRLLSHRRELTVLASHDTLTVFAETERRLPGRPRRKSMQRFDLRPLALR